MKKAKFFTATFAPHLRADDILQAKAEEIEQQGYELSGFQVTGAGQILILAFSDTDAGAPKPKTPRLVVDNLAKRSKK